MNIKKIIDNFVSGNNDEINKEINKIIFPLKTYLFLVIFLLIISILGNYYTLHSIKKITSLLKE